MKKTILIILGLLLVANAYAENYLLNGGQESRIDYKMIQTVEPKPEMHTLYLSYVIPETYNSPTYNQTISNINFEYFPRPDGKEEFVDQRGNKVIKLSWEKPRSTIKTVISLTAHNKTLLRQLETKAPFPLTNLPADVKPYLTTTKQVPASDPAIAAKARELTAGANTEFDAVQRILTYVIDHMNYVLTPEDYGAMYSFKTGKGNCQNYSHLSSALMRAVGIPSRIVNGITLKRPYTVDMGDRKLTLKMAEGRHSWIEVYFPDLGWVPFDPQQTQLFVSNRFIRVEIGVDNEETAQDGLIRWTQVKGALATPHFEETIEAAFVADNVNLAASKQDYGPRKFLFTPAVQATFRETPMAKKPEPPKEIPEQQLKQLAYSKPFMFGNLEFPKNIDFLATRGPAQKADGENFEMRKNFMVETAEYVTEQSQYAQLFVLESPLEVRKVGLVLHKFGGSGFLWLELLKDEDGLPGKTIATSQMLSLDDIKVRPGYDWVDFDLSRDKPKISPGRYWIALGFSGRPIVNWFYSYGKPVGPIEGTRYKTILDTEWSNYLNYEFNYRVLGYQPQ
ncbi:MAG: transglutaminase-like domain-containing protein [bacterium]|nr:transglutaminase-like domain-containing protein [bacterium]